MISNSYSCRLPVDSPWSMVYGLWSMLNAGYQSIINGKWSMVNACCWLPVAGCLLLVACR